MGTLRKFYLGLSGELTWRIKGWPIRLMTHFSQAERGSAYDMLAAAEQTERRDLRRTYLLHALDEQRHAGIFKSRVKALGGMDRAQAALSDAGAMQGAGIVGAQTLFERMGELEFLAFVHVVEQEALEQFQAYCDRDLPDPDTIQAFVGIANDEKFHISYSGRQLEHYRSEGRGAEVDKALRAVKWNRFKEGWLRTSKHIGDAVSSLWLWLLYATAVAPFRLVARLEKGGWQPVEPDPRDPVAFSRSQA